MKTYHGWRDHNGAAHVAILDPPNRAKLLPVRLDIMRYSPTGFEWGYGGSGPAQLALAILADALGNDEHAQRRHQFFKQNVIARLDRQQNWWLTEQAVRAALLDIEPFLPFAMRQSP